MYIFLFFNWKDLVSPDTIKFFSVCIVLNNRNNPADSSSNSARVSLSSVATKSDLADLKVQNVKLGGTCCVSPTEKVGKGGVKGRLGGRRHCAGSLIHCMPRIYQKRPYQKLFTLTHSKFSRHHVRADTTRLLARL